MRYALVSEKDVIWSEAPIRDLFDLATVQTGKMIDKCRIIDTYDTVDAAFAAQEDTCCNVQNIPHSEGDGIIIFAVLCYIAEYKLEEQSDTYVPTGNCWYAQLVLNNNK